MNRCCAAVIAARRLLQGDARTSLLYKLVTHEEKPGMPYKRDKLSDEVISQLGGWINAGASASKTPPVEVKSGSTDGLAIFTEQVRPLLETRCLMCHGGDKTVRSDLNLSTREGLITGGDNGPAVIPSDAQNTALYKSLAANRKFGGHTCGRRVGRLFVPADENGTVLADRRRAIAGGPFRPSDRQQRLAIRHEACRGWVSAGERTGAG